MTNKIQDFSDGVPLHGSELDNIQAIAYRGSTLNTIRQLVDRNITLSARGGEWAEAYTDADGRKNSVDSSLTTAVFDTDKYKTLSTHVIIEAASISSIGDFTINDCVISEFESGKWLLKCTTGTEEEKRAKIYKTLFYGTDGTDARASSTYITSITALKTSISRDVGKQAYYAYAHIGQANAATGYYTGTFTNTSTNNDCSSWSYVRASVTATSGSSSAYWQIPSGSSKNAASQHGNGTATSDEFNTDTTGDEVNNPTTCRLQVSMSADYTNGTYVKSVILCKGNITWVESGDPISSANIDFLTDNGIPLLTMSTLTSEITHNLPSGSFSSTLQK